MRAVLGAVLVLTVTLPTPTVHAAVTAGPDVLTVLSAPVPALLGVGIVGALLHCPER